MVTYLLDTHIVLRWCLGDARLGSTARTMIAAGPHQCAVSIASLWEVAIKTASGRGLPSELSANAYAGLVDEAGFRWLAIERAHAVAVERLAAIHGDPFDRLMIAQAGIEGMTLLTHDRALAAYGEFVVTV